ncbi:MAG: hypothetical protein HY888_05725 [Deltaproteobacteria bacterium]|nr:hypothetical protein [Deltaproteobacteria bacterium]
MMTWLKTAVLFVSIMILSGCANKMGLRDEFDKSVKGYNRMLRWHEVENAGMTYLDKDLRDEFMRKAETLRNRGVTMTDFRILTSECLPEKKSGEVIAEFEYFILPSNKLKSLTYRQEWVYQDLLSSWKLKSGLPAFD